MRIIIIEDDEEKLSSIIDFIQDRFDHTTITTAKSLHSGLRCLLDVEADIVLLDMTMRTYDRGPQEDGGRPHPFGGRDILRQMKRNRNATPVIVVTHFDRFGDGDGFVTLEQLKQELTDRFPNYRGTVQYRANVDDWKGALEAHILSVSRVGNN